MSQLTLIIGNYNYSSWSLRPWFYLQHQGIPFVTRRISLFTETMDRELEPYFSDGKVPILFADDLEIWDSLAILEFLVENFPDKGGLPKDRTARAQARSVCAEMHSSFTALRGELPMNCRRRFSGFQPSAEALRDIERVVSVWSYCRERFGAGGPWLFGEFSIADCMYAPVVMRLVSYEIAVGPVAAAYLENLYNSPAAQTWIALGKEESEVIQEDEADWPSEPI